MNGRMLGLAAISLIFVGVVVGLNVGPMFDGDGAAGGEQAGGPAGRGGAGGRGGFSFGGFTPAVTIEPVETAPVTRRIDAIGSSRALKSVELIAEAAGLVEEVAVEAGARVKKGDVILKIDARQQEIEISRLQAQYPIARDNAERYRALVEDDAATALEAENAFNNFKTIEADLRGAQYALSRRVVTAPFDGVVGLITLEAGDYVNIGALLATVDDTTSVIIDFRAPQETASTIAIGQKARAAMPSAPGEFFEGEITAIDTRVDEASRTLRIEAVFPNLDGALLPGAAYTVTSSQEGRKALAIPPLALQWDRGGAYVWKVEEDGAASRVDITVLQRQSDVIIGTGALVAGDRIITEGADRVRSGMRFGDRGREPSAKAAAPSAAGAP